MDVPDPDKLELHNVHQFLEAKPQWHCDAPEQEIDCFLSLSTHVLEPLLGSVIYEQSRVSDIQSLRNAEAMHI